MPERKEKSSTNGSKPLVKKEGVSASKSNGGVVKREADLHGHRKRGVGSSRGSPSSGGDRYSKAICPLRAGVWENSLFKLTCDACQTVKEAGTLLKISIGDFFCACLNFWDLHGKSVTNGVKSLVKKEAFSPSKPNGTHGSADKKDALSSGGKALVKSVTTITKVTSVRTEEKKGKKVFTLPGQKHEAPEERDPLRIFYESLHEQKPESEMAEFWMMEHGLLDAGHAKKTLERKQRRQQNEKNGTPLKSAAPSKEVSRVVMKSTLSNGKSSKVVESKGKRKRDSSDDDDFISAKPVKRKIKT